MRKRFHQHIRSPKFKLDKNTSVKEFIIQNKWYGCLLIIILALHFINKSLFVLALFLVFDIVRNIIKTQFPELPIDTSFYFLVLASYYYSAFLGLLIFFIGLINRVAFGNIEEKHILKIFRMIIIGFIIPFFRVFDFFYVAMFFMIFNEIMQIIINYMIEDLFDLKNILYYVLHISISFITFYFMSLFDFYWRI